MFLLSLCFFILNSFYIIYGIICIYLPFPVLFVSQGARGGPGDQGPEGPSGSKVRTLAIKFQIHQVNHIHR